MQTFEINYQNGDNFKVFVQKLDGSQGYFLQGTVNGAADVSTKNSTIDQEGYVGAYQVAAAMRNAKSFSMTLPIMQGGLRYPDGSDAVPMDFIMSFLESELVQIKYGFTPKNDPYNLKHDTVFNNGDEFKYVRCQTVFGNINTVNGDFTVCTIKFTPTAAVPQIQPR